MQVILHTVHFSNAKTLASKFVTLRVKNMLTRMLERGYAVAQLVEAPRYKPEGHGFDSRWCLWIFSLA
jgi:hypothetical protein